MPDRQGSTARLKTRDPQATRQRILEASLDEFSEKGLAGARIDIISRAAKVSVQMIYHYFESKEKLYEECLRWAFDTRGDEIFAALKSNSVAQDAEVESRILTRFYDLVTARPHILRLLQWEALQIPQDAAALDIIGYDERAARYETLTEQLLENDLDEKMLALTMIVVASAPIAFPQLTKIVCGSQSTDKEFRKSYHAFLSRLGKKLAAREGS